jgi:hypothetical protein
MQLRHNMGATMCSLAYLHRPVPGQAYSRAKRAQSGVYLWLVAL